MQFVGQDTILKSLLQKIVITICFLLAAGSIEAARKYTMPPGCHSEGYSFEHKFLVLHPHKAGNHQSLYMIHNITLSNINFYHARDNEDARIQLNNTIKPNQWGAFSTNHKVVKFICTKGGRYTNYGKVINCKKAIELCEYSNVKFAPNAYGNYWSIVSKSKKGAIYDIVRKQGILLR